MSAEETNSMQDFSEVANVPWVREMLDRSQATLNKTICEWAYIASQMTDDNNNINPWVESFHDHFNEMCANYITDMKSLESNVLCRIEKCLQKLENLCSLLKIEMPCVGQKKLCLFQEHQQLKRYISEYEILVKTKRTKFEELKRREQQLCKSLGRAHTSFEDNILLSQAEIEEFEEYVNKLETDKFTRLEKFTIIREEILKIVNELKYSPSTKFELKVCHYEDKFSITDDNMELLDTFHHHLIKELKNVVEESNRLRSEIEQFWNLLDIDLFEREQFRQQTSENNLKVLDILRSEKHKCERLKKDNIKVFIDRLRDDLVNIWNKCQCTDDIKNDFQYFYTDCYTEDLLELHENELEKWKRYYEENKELLTLLEKHKQCWLKMLDLDENTTGPKRYKNRGGQLLKEEKERNKLSKQVPKLEGDLLELAKLYEARVGMPFLVFGQPIEEYIDSLHADRENVRKQKLSAKKMQRDKLTPGGSTYGISMAQTASSSKRKLPFTPIPDSDKKPKLMGASTSKVVRKLNIPKLTVTCSVSKRYSMERKKKLNKIRRSFLKTSSSDYGAFQMEISSKTGCRSTLLDLEPPSNPLITPSKATTKTPVKLRTPQTPKTGTKLTAARSNLKLIF